MMLHNLLFVLLIKADSTNLISQNYSKKKQYYYRELIELTELFLMLMCLILYPLNSVNSKVKQSISQSQVYFTKQPNPSLE
jgi:hypothetical protein